MRTGEHLSVALGCLLVGAFTATLGLLEVDEPWRDWPIARAAGEAIASGHWDVYAHHPEAQMGPLALLLALLPHSLYTLLVSGAAGLFARLVLWATGVRGRWWHAVAGGLLIVGWHRFGPTGHADDVLVLLGVVLVIAAKRHSRHSPTPLVAAAVTVALVGKPTAALLLPAAWLVSRRGTTVGVVVGGAVWAPFAFADLSGFISAGGGAALVSPYSLWGVLGVDPLSPYPWFVRPLQLVLCGIVAWWVTRRIGVAEAMLTAFTIRRYSNQAPSRCIGRR